MINTERDLSAESSCIPIVTAENAEYALEAEALANKLGLEYIWGSDAAKSAPLALRLNENGLSLTGSGQEMTGDFTRMLKRLKQNNLQSELIIKAAKLKGRSAPLTVIDATAGMGEDSLLLAAAGYNIRLYEKNPIIAALLRDAIRRAKECPELSHIAARMRLFEEDSIKALGQLSEKPDIILLDPMFPERQKSSLVKKKFQLLHLLECPCEDEEALLHAAIFASPRKIIIKRPLKGSNLAGIKPSYSLIGKAIRYDCIIPLRSV